MIEYLKKDITTVERGIVAHGVNCSHAFGSGVAGAIRKKWPDVCERYMERPWMVIGDTQWCWQGPELCVVNCFTQEKYGYDGKKYANLAAIASCLLGVITSAPKDYTVYMPKIGCGLGGLNWLQVYPIVESIESIRGTHIVVCEL